MKSGKWDGGDFHQITFQVIGHQYETAARDQQWRSTRAFMKCQGGDRLLTAIPSSSLLYPETIVDIVSLLAIALERSLSYPCERSALLSIFPHHSSPSFL